jgi:hypothetical protein
MLEFVTTDDVASLVGLIAVLSWIGSAMIRRHAGLRSWGWRFAAGALLLYCGAVGAVLDRRTPAVWLRIVCRGLLAAGLTLGTSWIALSVFGFMKSASDRAAGAVRARADARRREQEQKRREREEQKRREQGERHGPERERQRQLAEERRLQLEATAREARQTREDTRYACELFYNLHAPKIGDRFSKQDLHDFLNRYMGDAQSLDVIRRRAAQLTETIRQHVEAVDPPDQIESLEGLAAWYAKQRALLEGLNVEPNIRQEFCIQLRDRYTTLTERLLEVVKP